MLKTYRSKSTVQAEQFTGSIEMMKKYRIESSWKFSEGAKYRFPDYKGMKELKLGDYIITDHIGDRCEEALLFSTLYESLPVIPVDISKCLEKHKKLSHSITDFLQDIRFSYADQWQEIAIDREIASNVLARAWLDGYTTEDE